jgi:hypothetical protein
MAEKFRATFKVKLGIKGESRDHQFKSILVDYDRLKESKLKPPNTFNFKKGSYIYNPKAISGYDEKNRPIIEYFLGNSLPITKHISQSEDEEPSVIDEDGKKITINAYILHQTFDRGEMKAIIASSQKEPQKFDWMTLVIGAVMGTPLGIILGLVLAQHGL